MKRICKILFLVSMIMVSGKASYKNTADTDLAKKRTITQRTKQTRYRVSDNTKLIKIYFTDIKKLTFTTNNQKNLTR